MDEVRVEAARDPCVQRAERKGGGLVADEVHPHRSRGDLTVADGHERAAGVARDDVPREDRQHDEHGRGEVVEILIGSENDRGHSQRERRQRQTVQSRRAAGPRTLPHDKLRDREAEAKRRDREVRAGKAQSRQAQ